MTDKQRVAPLMTSDHHIGPNRDKNKVQHTDLRLRVRAALRKVPQLRAQFLQLLRVVGAVFGQLLHGRLLCLVGLAGVGRWVGG